jgi:nitrilase
MQEPFKVAAVQMVSEPSLEANLGAAEELIADATDQGAKLVVLPEWFCFMGRSERDKLAIREADGDGPIQSFLARVAAKRRAWVIAGTVPLRADDPGRLRNSSLVFDDAGRRVARYDKIHLFDFTDTFAPQPGSGELRGGSPPRPIEQERYRESSTVEPGTTPVAIDSPFGRIGLSICYDVRFPELYRRLAPMDLITVPSAFTATTGAAHWDLLVRARAVENLAWVIAPAQGGHHLNGRRTHGHTMVVDPWGKVLGSLAHGPGVVVAEIDPSYQAKVRASLPALAHRVL